MYKYIHLSPAFVAVVVVAVVVGTVITVSYV
jgi:hypothetical protein